MGRRVDIPLTEHLLLKGKALLGVRYFLGKPIYQCCWGGQRIRVHDFIHNKSSHGANIADKRFLAALDKVIRYGYLNAARRGGFDT